MRIFIVADIEGAVGIYRRSQCYFLKPDFQYGKSCLTQDVNAIVAGALEGGADSVIVRDTHETGQNIIVERLHPRAQYVGGHFAAPFPILGDLKGSDLVFLLASHARSGNDEGFFGHTFFGGFGEVRVNGLAIGEAFIYGAALAEVEIPVAFNSGDSHAVRESLSVMPWLKTVAVPKEEEHYTGPDGEKNMSALRGQLRMKAAQAVRERDSMRLLTQPPHPRWEVDTKKPDLAAKIRRESISLSDKTLTWDSETYTDGFSTLMHLVQSAFLAYSQP
jgi:D-aminopeptidase